MSKLFKTLGAIWLIGGFIGGVIVFIIMEGNWLTGITWLISGAIMGALFYTVGEIHEIVWENNALLRRCFTVFHSSLAIRSLPWKFQSQS